MKATEDEISTSKPHTLERSFLALLVEDVLIADALLASEDDQGYRRNVVRTAFAALEGAVWLCREHVREIAQSMGELSPLASLALRERTYTVSEQGDLIEQVRYVTLPAMIRLTVKQAQNLAPGFSVDFSDSGWSKLRAAIVIRNRATHPKSVDDLAIVADELRIVRDAFSWVLALTENVTRAAVAAQALQVKDLQEILEALKRGDPLAIRAYQHALEQADDEDG